MIAATFWLAAVITCATFVAVHGSRPVVAAPATRGTTAPQRTLPPVLVRLRHAPAARRRVDATADDLPDVVELMLVAGAAGGNVRRAVEIAVLHHDGPASDLLRDALHDVGLGGRLSDALLALTDRVDPPTADAIRPLASVLVDCDHYGTPLVPSLQRLADDLRIHRQRRAETRARRVPVRLLLPLVLCVLPAFALLTVAPLFAGMARDALAEHNDPFEGTSP